MPQDLGDNKIDPRRMARISSERASQLSRHHLQVGDIVYSRRGDVTRRALVRDYDAEMICGTGCLRVRVDPSKADSRYVSYALGTPTAKEWIVRHAVGATMANLNTNILSALPLELPDLPEQRRVAKVLEALDEKIAANRRIINGGLSLMDAVYSQIDKTRSSKTFSDVASLGGGGTPSTKDEALWDGELRWATPTDVTGLDGPWLLSTERRISRLGLEKITSKMYPRGSILMSSRASIGYYALAAEPTAVNQGFIVVNAKVDQVPQSWLFAQLRSRTSEFIAWANGATFLELPKGIFRSLCVDLPEPAQLAAFDCFADPLLRRLEAAQNENNRLANARDEFLPHLMTGRITVMDGEERVEQEA